MAHKNPMSRVERLHREKVTRYSIRKYSFGAASVAVAALFMFLGNGAVSADMTAVQAQDESELKVKSNNENTELPQVDKEVTQPAESTPVAQPIAEESIAKPAEPATPALDKTQLESYIAEIEAKLANGSYANKTDESVAVLKADLEAAKTTLVNATSQDELTKAYNKLVTTANTKLKNKPVEKKETPAVDTTNGKETVGKKAENTEKNPDSNSIENTGSKDSRNGQALDRNNVFRAETTATQGNFTYSMEYSTGNEIYLYNEEEADVNITVNSTAGNIKRATVKAGSGQFVLKSKSDQAIAYAKGQGGVKPEEEEVEIDGYGWSYHQTLSDTPGPVKIKITGKPNDTFKAIKTYTKTEDQRAVLGARYLELEDSNGNKLAGGSNLRAPGAFNLVVKSQTYKYDIQQPESNDAKIAVSNVDSLTEADITKIKNELKIKYSDKATTEDARLASKRGEVVNPRSSVVKEIAVANGTVTVTYNDDSVDTAPVASVARTNAAPTVEIPFSVDGKKDVYVYANEDFELPIKFKDDSGKVASATITRGGNVEQPPKDASNPNILNNEFNTTVEKISTETVATAETPAIVKIKGNISKDNSGIPASSFPKTAEGELKIVTRYATATDTDGAYIKNTATEQAYASDPGSFTIKLKAQTAKYDIKDPETKVTVANANNITEDEFNQIKNSIKIQYSTTNPDKHLLDKQGKDVENQTDRIESITREGNNVVVTYKDGSKDTIALDKVVKLDKAPAIKAVEDKATEQIAAINGNSVLSQAEKDAAIAKVNAGKQASLDKIDDATNNDAINVAKTEGTEAVAKVNPVAKDAAKQAVADALNAKKDALEKRTDLSDVEKAKAKEEAKKAADDAIAEIDKQPAIVDSKDKAIAAQTAVDDQKTTATKAIAKVNPIAKQAALDKIDAALKAKEKEMDGRADLTDEEKTAAKEEAKRIAETKKAEINGKANNADTPEEAERIQGEINTAGTEGETAIKAVTKDAAKKPAEKIA